MPNYFATFEIDERECRVLHLKKQKTALSVEDSFTIPFPDDLPENTEEAIKIKGEAIKQYLKQKKFKSDENIMLLPKQFVTVRHISLPSDDEEELAQMAKFEAEKNIPFNVERHIISHYVMKKTGVSGSRTLIAVADDPVVREPLQMLMTAGIQPSIATVSSIGLGNLFLYQNPSLPEEKTITLIHIDMDAVELIIIQKGVIVFSRSTSNGIGRLLSGWNELGSRVSTMTPEDISQIDIMDPGNYFSPAGPSDAEDESEMIINPDSENTPGECAVLEQWKSRLTQAIQQTYDFARREFDCPSIENIYISGEGARFINMPEYLSRILGIIVEPFRITEDKFKNSGNLSSSYYPLLGGSLVYLDAERIVDINLLPKDFIEKKSARQRMQSIISLAAMILAVLILAGLYWKAYNTRQEKLTNWYESELKLIRPQVKELVDMDKKRKIIESYVRDERNALAILNRLSNWDYLPNKVAIVDFKYTKGAYVEITGHALTIKDLNKFVADLENSGFFRNVNIKQRPWRSLPKRSKQVLLFTLVCYFQGDK